MSQEQAPIGEYPQIEAFQKTRAAREGDLIPLPLQESLPEELTAIADELEALTGHWNPVVLYTPSKESREREQAAFFQSIDEGSPVEPTFEYPAAASFEYEDARTRLETLLATVRALQPTGEIGRLAKVALYFKIQDDLATCGLAEGMQTRNEALIGTSLGRKYPGTDPLLVRDAERLYREACVKRTHAGGELTEAQKTGLRSMRFDAAGVKESYEWALKQYGLLNPPNGDGFKVVIDPQAMMIDVRDKCEGGPTIIVPADASKNGEELAYLIAHEVEGHARQAMNGRTLFRVGGAMLRTDDETLYEGLAMRQEEAFVRRHFGEAEDPESPLYVLAIALAEQGKRFSEIFLDQEEKWLHVYGRFDADQPLPARETLDPALREKARNRAWRTALRVLRGHTDMRNVEGFAMAKDAAYLRGQLLDAKLRSLGLGAVNESAIISTSGLPLLSRFDVKEEDLPYPYIDVASDYLTMLLAKA